MPIREQFSTWIDGCGDQNCNICNPREEQEQPELADQIQRILNGVPTPLTDELREYLMTHDEILSRFIANQASETLDASVPIFNCPTELYTQEYNTFDASFYNGETTINIPFIQPQDKKPVNVMPRKMNKLKEWSISARALKHVIAYSAKDTSRYDYKFDGVYDQRYRLYRIWNATTKNVVATIKRGNNNTAFVRFRPNSFYAPVFATLNELPNSKIKFKVLPSKNLGLHRGTWRDFRVSASKEAQLGFRESMYRESLKNKEKAAIKKASAKRG